MLRFLHDRFPLAYEYISALPIAGHDGTLLRRFKKPERRGLIRAKTGTMTGVVSLSGYLYTANAHTLAFAIFINNMPGTSPKISGRYRYLVDALCTNFLMQKPKHHLIQLIKNAHARVAYQRKPPQAAMKRKESARWRSLETALKRALNNKGVALLYRGNEIVLKDYNSKANNVWSILQTIRKKHPFGVTLESSQPPNTKGQLPLMLWVNTPSENQQTLRTWTIKETTS